ncbi:MAG TPA: glycosyltransferase 87 family protein [Thermoplasmata archaeon]|nr:glycosyltransferase 87 family protein [Thermoplasmata archaeon]
MSAIGLAGSTLVFVSSFALSFVVLAYRSPALPSVRRGVDRLRQWTTGRSDWKWLRLWHVLLPVAAVSVANIVWNVSSAHCSDDSYAILASGLAALHGQDPFSVAFCGHSYATSIPYGLAEVALDALGALGGSILGIWLVWQLFALAVIPLVWSIGGDDRRYVTVLVATSVLYLPNIATNLGVENIIVAVSVLTMLYGLTLAGGRGGIARGVAAFLSTARFPAVFPLLGSSASLGRRRWRELALVIVVFLSAAALSWWLWGWGAIQVVYLGQFARANSESLNLFALLIHEGWFQPSLAAAAVQGAGLLLLVLFVQLRGYSPAAACAVPLIGVMIFSQYLNYHFLAWLVPLVLLGPSVNWWLLAFATVAAVNENVLYWYLALDQGVWWPYELAGIVLLAILLLLLVRIVRDEETRLRSRVREHPSAG